MSIQQFYAHAFHAICIAGPGGLSVAEAADAASHAQSGARIVPRRGRVRWLHFALLRYPAMVEVRGPDDGSAIAVASHRCRLRALGHHTLEHANIAAPAAEILAHCGRSGKSGIVQSDLAGLLRLPFGTTHHYLLSVLVNDLVLRYRVQRSIGSGHSAVSQQAMGTSARHSAWNVDCFKNFVTSELVLLRYAANRAQATSADCAAPMQIESSNDAPCDPESANTVAKELSPDIFGTTRRILARAIILQLRRIPSGLIPASRMRRILRNQVNQFKCSSSLRRKLVAVAKRRLRRAGVISIEHLPGVDESGHWRGRIECLRLNSKHVERLGLYGSADICNGIDSIPLSVGVNDARWALPFNRHFSSKATHMWEPPSIGAYHGRTVPRQTDLLDSALKYRFLLPYENLPQLVYAAALNAGEAGVSRRDICGTFRIRSSHAKFLLEEVERMHPTSFTRFEHIRRTKTAVLVVRKMRRKEIQQSSTQLGSYPHGDSRASWNSGSLEWTHRDSAVAQSLTEYDAPEVTGAPGCVSVNVSLASPLNNVAPSVDGEKVGSSPRPSTLASRRGQVLEELLSKFGYLRRDLIGVFLGRIEKRRGFKVDGRVLGRIIDNLVLKGVAKRAVLRAPVNQKYHPVSREVIASYENSRMILAPVEHVVSVDRDLGSSSIVEDARIATDRLMSHLSEKSHLSSAPLVRKPEQTAATVSRAAGGHFPNVAFCTVSSATCREKMIISTLPKLDLTLKRIRALDFGFRPGLFSRLQRYHMAAFRCLTENADSTRHLRRLRSCNVQNDSIGILQESDIVGSMTLQLFAEVIGIFCDPYFANAQSTKTLIRDLPADVQESVTGNSNASEQRRILLFTLSRMGLLQACTDHRWSLSSRFEGDACGHEKLGGHALPQFCFSSAADVERFWETLRYSVSAERCDMNKSDVSSSIWSGRMPPELVVSDPELSGSAFPELRHPAFWTETSRDRELSVDEEILIERGMRKGRRLKALSDEHREWHRRPLSKPLAKVLFRSLTLTLSNQISREKIARYLRKRLSITASNVVELSLKRRSARIRSGRRKTRASSRKLFAVPVDSQVSLMKLVAGLRAVVLVQEPFHVRAPKDGFQWHLHGVLGDFTDDEVRKLWDDISGLIGHSVDECKTLYVELCKDEDLVSLLRRQVEADAVTLSQVEEGTFPVLRYIGSHSDSGIKSYCVPQDFTDEFRTALMAIAQRRLKKRQRASRRFQRHRKISHFVRLQTRRLNRAVPQREDAKRFLRGKRDEDDEASSVTERETPQAVSNVSNGTNKGKGNILVLGVFLPADCGYSEKDNDRKNHPALSPLSLLNVAIPAVVEIFRLILREPSESFIFANARNTLSQFQNPVLENASDMLVLRRLARVHAKADSTRRVLALKRRTGVSQQSLRLKENAFLYQQNKSKLAESVFSERSTLSSEMNNGVLNLHAASRQKVLAAVGLTFVDKTFSTSLTLAVRNECGHAREVPQVAHATFDNFLNMREETGVNVMLSVDKGSASECRGSQLAFPAISCEQRWDSGVPELAQARIPIHMDALSRLLTSCGCESSEIAAANQILSALHYAGFKGLALPRLFAVASPEACCVRTLIRTLADLVKLRVVARLVVCEKAFPETGGVLYMLYESASSTMSFQQSHSDFRPCGSMSLKVHASARPFTAWSNIHGGLDDDLCHQMQSLIMGTLTCNPGSSEDVLCDICESLSVPRQATRDLLWALTKRSHLRLFLCQRRSELCTLFSPAPRAREAIEFDHEVLSFVDGLGLSKVSSEVVAHYSVASDSRGKLLSAAEVVATCEGH